MGFENPLYIFIYIFLPSTTSFFASPGKIKLVKIKQLLHTPPVMKGLICFLQLVGL